MMLLLTRKTGEAINIGDTVKLKVLANDGRSVRIGIDAPKSIPVHREEIYRHINEQGAGQIVDEVNGNRKVVLIADK